MKVLKLLFMALIIFMEVIFLILRDNVTKSPEPMKESSYSPDLSIHF